jgi:hypothetical protein
MRSARTRPWPLRGRYGLGSKPSPRRPVRSARVTPTPVVAVVAVRLLRWLALGLYLIAVFRAAWLSDDAFIALRAVHNFASGNGLVSNPGERVQGFTSPFWTLLLALPYTLTREPYFSTLGLSVLVSAGAVGWLAFRASSSAAVGALAVSILAMSRAFTDYSTSGLENPLTHLLLVVFAWLYLGTDAGSRTSGFLRSTGAWGTSTATLLTGTSRASSAGKTCSKTPACGACSTYWILSCAARCGPLLGGGASGNSTCSSRRGSALPTFVRAKWRPARRRAPFRF